MFISRPFSHTKITLSLLFICSIFLTHHVFANSYHDLMEKYENIEDSLLQNSYEIPIYIDSNVTKSSMRGDIFGILYHSFKTVSGTLKTLDNWCAIMPQHINIKACTYQHANNKCHLTFYTGRKFYQKADDVYRLNYNFKVTSLNSNYFSVSLKAKNGPLDTTDYNIQVEAIPLTDESTFIHLSYDYSYGLWTRMGMSTYLATLGRDKVGFTIEKNDKNNKPVYVQGIRGIIERNAMRYYFAIQSHLKSLPESIDMRFETRIKYWFDLTEKYAKQLYEMDRNDYLKYKRMEHQDQIRLQKNIHDNSKIPINSTVSSSACINTN